MQFDARKQRVIAPVGAGVVHYHLQLGKEGTGLHHAQLSPLSLDFHEHEAIQVSIPLGNPSVSVKAHSSVGSESAHKLLPGQCYIVPPNQPHSFAIDRPGDLVNLYLASSFFDAGLQDFFLDAHRLLKDFTVSDDLVLFHHAASLRSHLKQTQACEKIQVEATTIDIAEHLAEHYCDRTGPLELRSSKRLSPRVLVSVLGAIEDRCTQDLSVVELAGIAGLSAVHFRRLFLNSTGQSPLAFVYKARIHRAQALLRRTNRSVQEIGTQVGFATSAHFVAQFRKKVGVTPLRYKQDFRSRRDSFNSYLPVAKETSGNAKFAGSEDHAFQGS